MPLQLQFQGLTSKNASKKAIRLLVLETCPSLSEPVLNEIINTMLDKEEESVSYIVLEGNSTKTPATFPQSYLKLFNSLIFQAKRIPDSCMFNFRIAFYNFLVPLMFSLYEINFNLAEVIGIVVKLDKYFDKIKFEGK